MPQTPETKPWYTSKTLWGSVISFAVIGLGIINRPEQAAALEAEAGNIIAIVAGVIGLVSSAVAIYGRFVAKTKLTK